MQHGYRLAFSGLWLATLLAIGTRPRGEFAQSKPAEPLKNYTETIPGTSVTFEMIAIPAGSAPIGSPESEQGRKDDEGPVHNVTLSPFWIERTEVTWDEYEQYYFGVGAPLPKDAAPMKADAITRPTPPYGAPDLGWGRGKRPAISMTWYAATQYCRWLSAPTGKKYRLPTEAEWEYACRAGSKDAYYFGNDPSQLGEHSWFSGNSKFQSHPAASKKPNAWGLHDMLGNVAEFCMDYYSPEEYRRFAPDKWPADPTGQEKGVHRVVRGGSYLNPAARLRSAARDRTYHDEWLYTDPQEPKSKWWYSDCFFVGFRVVRVL